jgi:amino acid adenylation domain-containing protein
VRYQWVHSKVPSYPALPDVELHTVNDVQERIRGLSPVKRALLERRLGQEKSALPDPAVRRGQPGDPRPLSFAQEGLWLQEQMDPGSPAYNSPYAFEMRGDLAPPVLQQALTALVERHEILRTRYVCQESGAPMPVLDAVRTIPLPIVNSIDADLLPLLRAESRRPFDLSRDCMLRALLIRLRPDAHVLLLVVHHIAFDAWSYTVLFKELAELYRAFRTNRRPALAPLPIQYADYARWQRHYMQGKVLQSKLNYWKQQLANAPKVLDLSFGRTRSASSGGGPRLDGAGESGGRPRLNGAGRPGARITRRIGIDLQAAVERFSQQHECTLFVTMLAAFAVLLHRYSGQERLVVGTPAAGRDRPEFSPLIGCFINSLALAADFADDPSFLNFLERMRTRVRDVYAHGDLPFEKLVEELHPHREIGRTPLVQATFNFKNLAAMSGGISQFCPANREADHAWMAPAAWDANLRVERLDFDREVAIFDLELQITLQETGLSSDFNYDSGLFDPDLVAAMADNYATLLAGIVEDPDHRVSELSLLSAAERARVLVEWNDTRKAYPSDICLHQLFEAQVARTPDVEAVVFEDQRLTYRELDERSNQLAHYLQRAGVGPETLVGIAMERSPLMVVALLGVLKAGGAYVPLDPAYPKDRLDYMKADANLSIILSEQGVEWKGIRRESAAPCQSGVGSDNLAYVIYTSGSTGRPKGVAISHRAVVNLLASMALAPGISPEDTLLSVTTLSFDIAALEIYLPLLNGARLALANRETAADGEALLKEMQFRRPTIMQATPTTWRMLLEVGWTQSPGLKVLCGGEAIPPDMVEPILARVDSLWNMYGPTETTIWSAVQPLRSGERVTIGKPIANTQIYILDKNLRPVPPGVVGELFIGGHGLARGYWNRPELTAEKFIPNPFRAGESGGGPRLDGAGERVYRTGDLARWLPDGRIECLGRTDQQVKIRGFRIELGEIESVMRQHPAVQDALVAIQEYGSSHRRLVGYVTSAMEREALVESLQQSLRAALPGYMVPSALVRLQEFPKLPNGKIDRMSLPLPALPAAESFVAPRTPSEELVAAAWRAALHVKRVGVRDNFFDLGGASLAAVEAAAALQRTTGVRLSPAEMAGQTLAQVAAIYQQRARPAGAIQAWFASRFPEGERPRGVWPALWHFASAAWGKR